MAEAGKAADRPASSCCPALHPQNKRGVRLPRSLARVAPRLTSDPSWQPWRRRPRRRREWSQLSRAFRRLRGPRWAPSRREMRLRLRFHPLAFSRERAGRWDPESARSAQLSLARSLAQTTPAAADRRRAAGWAARETHGARAKVLAANQRPRSPPPALPCPALPCPPWGFSKTPGSQVRGSLHALGF